MTPASAITWEQAEAAARARPDLPASAVANARKVGPAALLALAQNHPTPEAFTEAEREERRKLRLATCRAEAARALEAVTAMEGLVDKKHVDDAFKRDVAIAIGAELLAPVRLLATWARADARGEVAPRIEWLAIRAAAEDQAVKTALFRAATIIQQARAESHVRKRKRRSKEA